MKLFEDERSKEITVLVPKDILAFRTHLREECRIKHGVDYCYTTTGHGDGIRRYLMCQDVYVFSIIEASKQFNIYFESIHCYPSDTNYQREGVNYVYRS